MPRQHDDESSDPLRRYRAKRDFSSTCEPSGPGMPRESQPRFVIQKHWARRLHYDFRLELSGTLKSWAIPKGPSLDPKQKRMAVQVEDHPLSYADFEGEIGEGNYGAGRVIVWDRGRWSPVGDPLQGYENGKLGFALHGEKLSGGWALVRMRGKPHERQPSWLLIKERDAAARDADDYDVLDALPDSVLSGAAPGPCRQARTNPF